MSAASEEELHPGHPHLNSSVESSTFEVFQALYEREYAERLKVANLMNSLADVAEKKKEQRAELASRSGHGDLQDSFVTKGIFAMGMQLPDVIDHDGVVDMLKRMVRDGERIHLDSFKRIIDEAMPVLAAEPNIQLIENDRRVVVIGDLHGSIADLLLCFEAAGYPGDDVDYVFNGDFVDRGEHGVEVLSVLLAFKLLYPDTVKLNRGNHEDMNVGRAYGFFDEVMTKYGTRAIYDLVGEMYTTIPLCTIIRNKAFIVHAGIPSLPGATIFHVGAIGRRGLKGTVASQWDVKDPEGKMKPRPSSLRMLEDLLWSDPVAPDEGAFLDDFSEPNVKRGAGIVYGPKMIREWLHKLGCKYMVRSHQCVETGAETLDCGQGMACYTVFSASNYQGGSNEAALLVFQPGDGPPQILRQRVSNPGPELAQRNRAALVNLVAANKKRLRRGFAAAAGGGAHIPLNVWGDVMRQELGMDLDFCKIRGELLTPVSFPSVEAGVDYNAFLDSHKVEVAVGKGKEQVVCGQGRGDSLQAFLPHRNMLGAVFRMIDVNGDGMLSREEVESGVEMLNQSLPEADRIDADALFAVMDSKGKGQISIDEFTEIWNISV